MASASDWVMALPPYADTQLTIRDVCMNGMWDFSLLRTNIPTLMLDKIRSTLPHFHPTEQDCWIWSQASSGKYTASAAAFFHSSNIYIWLKSGVTSFDGTLFLAAIWWIWRWRNNIFLNDVKWTIDFVIRSINQTHDEFLAFLGPQGNRQLIPLRLTKWSPPPCGVIKINVDDALPLAFHQHLGLIQDILSYTEKDWNLTFCHVLRKGNKVADLLARTGASSDDSR
ncbi:putative ribonuclease H protein [Sesbania bispinosa]|nr:putative ribonuclease H protein [Sesbania bispinosa]